MSSIPNLKKRVSWGDVPPIELPNTESTQPKTDQVSTENKTAATTDEEKKRAARLKIKNALLGAAASAGNDKLSNLMQAHIASSPIPIQPSSTAKNVEGTETKSGMLLPERSINPSRVRRLSDCVTTGEDVTGQSTPPKGGNNSGSKLAVVLV